MDRISVIQCPISERGGGAFELHTVSFEVFRSCFFSKLAAALIFGLLTAILITAIKLDKASVFVIGPLTTVSRYSSREEGKYSFWTIATTGTD